MSAITISRQLGSLGDQVAQLVADRLRYRLVGHELVNQAAARAGTPVVALEVMDILGLLDLHSSRPEQEAYQQSMRTLMRELVAEGNVVILGRAGCVLLDDHPHVFHVRLVAALELRIERTARRQSISSAAARAQVEASDQARRRYVHEYHQVDWDDPHLYDLVVSTDKLDGEATAGLICLAAAAAKSGSDTRTES